MAKSNFYEKRKEEGKEKMRKNAEKKITAEMVEDLLDSYPEEDSRYLEEHIERKHVYENEKGEPYMRILKLDGESGCFMAQRFEKDKFVTGTKGLKYIPYKLPELIKSVKQNKTIFIANGEQDCDTLAELNFPATTAPFTIATKWNNNCNQYIKGANVVVIKELSETAQEFAFKTLKKAKFVARNASLLSLEKVCKKLNIECDEKTDITKLRTELNDEKQLISLLQSISDKMKGEC